MPSGDSVAKSYLRDALAAWAEILGTENVNVSASARIAAETATFATDQSVEAILRPGSRTQLQALLQVANRFHVAVYPTSTGKNWGYGSRVPVTSGGVLVDLSRINKIVDFREDLAYVTVEPGVTQRQLFHFLRDQKSRLWMDATGSSPDCSLIGNAMERGFGHTPMGDHFAHLAAFEVVLGTGEVVETGFGHLPGAKAAPVYRWGVGPFLDGLFTQSNFGIVTRMTIWLMPRPEYFQAFFFQCANENLAPVIDGLRELRLSGTVRSSIHFANEYKILAGIQQYPWEHMGGKTPLMPSDMAILRKRLGFSPWAGSGGLYGTRAQVAEARRLVKQALAPFARIQFLDDRKLALAARFSRGFRLLSGWDLTKTLELVRPIYGLMKGEPTEASLASAYWRKRTPIPEDRDPDRDRCGLLWCAPVAPAAGPELVKLEGLTSNLMLERSFEPQISLTLINERSICSVVSICYDREIAGEDEAAKECYRELVNLLENNGYYSYRLGITAPKTRNGDSFDAFLAGIKKIADPNNILAPGRYRIH